MSIKRTITTGMRGFSISELEKFSGIKAHTLRTWEQRYGIPKPQRNIGNSRVYSIDEVRDILYIALLNRYGGKISVLTKLSSERLEQKTKLLSYDDSRQQLTVINMLISMYKMKVEAFENLLNSCFETWPVHAVINTVIYPFLKLTCLLWQGNKLPEEHLVVTVLRKKLIYAIERLGVSIKKDKTVLLFLTNTRQLDLALLYACYILTHAGVKVVYMGDDVSIENLGAVAQEVAPDYLFTYLPNKNCFRFDYLTNVLDEVSPRTRLVVIRRQEPSSVQQISDKVLSMNFDDALFFLSQ